MASATCFTRSARSARANPHAAAWSLHRFLASGARLVRAGLADTSATLLLATLHGLLLDLVLTNEPARIERAFVAFLATLSPQKVAL